MASNPRPTTTQPRALLLLPLPSFSYLTNPSSLLPSLHPASQQPLSRLLIVLISPLFRPASQGGLNARQHWHALQRLVGTVYVAAVAEALERGEWERRVEVLLEPPEILPSLGERVGTGWEVIYAPDSQPPLPPNSGLADLPRLPIPSPHLPAHLDPTVPSLPPPAYYPPQHRITALGGTFDHLHAGHRILLSLALLLTSHTLIVGLTSPSLLKSKKHAELVESFEERKRGVEEFCRLFRPGVTVEGVEISDVAGPTAWDSGIEALVVSRETVGGAEAIAKIRATNHLPALEVYVIDVVSPTEASLPHEDAERLKEAKISSTAIRGWLAERRAKEQLRAGEAQ